MKGLEPEAHKRFFASARNYAGQHLEKALQWREKLWLSEEAWHLVMASVVGLMGESSMCSSFFPLKRCRR